LLVEKASRSGEKQTHNFLKCKKLLVEKASRSGEKQTHNFLKCKKLLVEKASRSGGFFKLYIFACIKQKNSKNLS
ncbi:hypothetical protein, partial [Anaerotaenia torta]|uniref:hypothetical protein n=1 Tax=Anaerotaenia torta TaxID=433293 RepID=UPI003D23A185